MKLSLLVIANNADWQSWPQKIGHLGRRLREIPGVKAVSIDLHHLKVKNIPLEKEPDQSNQYQLKRSWVDSHLPSQGYDMFLFLVTQKDWKKWGGDSINAGRFYPDIPVAYVIADEKTTLKRRDGKTYNRFLTVAEHEVQHMLCKLTKQDDRTHEFRDKGDLEGMWRYLTFMKSRLTQWALAIKRFEGWYPGSRSYRNNNPGNLRYSPMQDGTDGGFAWFRTYDKGWNALLHQLRIAATGKSLVYRPHMTLLQFFQKYAPSSDGNHPQTYAKAVARELGVPVTTQIKELL